MADVSRFLKKNKATRENAKYAATQNFLDEKGNPIEWEIRPITTEMNDDIQNECTIEVPIPGKPGMYRQKLNTTKYLSKLIAASIVEPNLNSKELQEDYGVMSAEALVKKLIDRPGEYADLAQFIQQFNGFDKTLQDEVDEVKN